MLENGIYIFVVHPLLLTRIQVSDPGPIGPLVFKITFSKSYFKNTIWVSNSLVPDQARCDVEPDLVPDCLQNLSTDNTSSIGKGLTEYFPFRCS